MGKAIIFSRFALFVVYFWFGILKVLDLSPVNSLVLSLLSKMVPSSSIDPHTFLIALGIFEILIGLLILIPKFVKLALFLLVIHMIIVCLPLIMLSDLTWKSLFVPTMEGQYIIKNILIISIAFTIAVSHRRY